jgi:S-DNA-T family DNA segregation ATPase FtsK/SpoIIIE
MSDPGLAPGLIERTGPHAGARHAIGVGLHVLGRGQGASIELDDPDVSRSHAQVEITPDRIVVEDLGSKNGVYVDGARLEGKRRLSHGDRFDIGGITLEVDHPGARVGKVLAAGGETTMTRTSVQTASQTRRPGLLLPVLGVVVFGVLVVALLLLG